MNTAPLGLALLACAGWTYAQDAIQGIDDATAERARIADVRRAKSTEFAAQDKACITRFAVNPCRREVEQRRREMEAELKRQETALNDAERRKRGAEKTRQLEEKRTEREQQDASRDAIDDIRMQDERVQAQRDKALSHQQKAAVPQVLVSSEPRGGSFDAQTIARNQADYQKKMDAAAQRKRDHEKSRQTSKPVAKSLPLPP